MAREADPNLRVSDADRNAVAEHLRVAQAEGRLTIDEYDERLQKAYAAVVRADLNRLTVDLPTVDAMPSLRQEREAAERRASESARRQQARTKQLGEWRSWAGTAVLLIGIWGMISLAAGQVIFFFPMFPIGIWALCLIGNSFNHRGG